MTKTFQHRTVLIRSAGSTTQGNRAAIGLGDTGFLTDTNTTSSGYGEPNTGGLLINDTNTHVGQAFDVSMTTLCGFQLIWSGTAPVGTVAAKQSFNGGVTWSPVFNAAGNPVTASISGNTGTSVITLPDICAAHVRLEITLASGTGTFQNYFVGKGF